MVEPMEWKMNDLKGGFDITIQGVVDHMNKVQENHNTRLNILFGWVVFLSITLLSLLARVLL